MSGDMSAIVMTALPVADDAETTRGAVVTDADDVITSFATGVTLDALTARHTSLPDATFLQTSETLWETTLAPALLQTPPGLATVPDTTAKPEFTQTTPANKQALTVERNKPFTGACHPICDNICRKNTEVFY